MPKQLQVPTFDHATCVLEQGHNRMASRVGLPVMAAEMSGPENCLPYLLLCCAIPASVKCL